MKYKTQTLPLEDCLETLIDYRGKTPKKTELGIPLITAKIIKNGRIETPTEFIAEDNYDAWMRRGLPKAGDVVLTVEAPLGEVAQLGSEKIALAQRVVTLRGKKGLLDNDFLLYLLQSGEMQELLKSRATGTTVLGIKQSELRKIPMALPSIQIQVQAASILKAIDNRIALLCETNQTLEAIAQTIFKSWFVDFDPVKFKAEGRKPEGMDDAIASLFPSSFTESNLCLIPNGWVLGKLGDIANNPRTGVQPTEISSDIPYIGLEHMPRHSISLYEWEGAGKVTSTKSAMQAGDFLFGKLRPYFHKVGISPIDGITSTDILVVRPKSDYFYSYLIMLISNVSFIEYTNKTSQGTRMPRTSWSDMSRYECILPNEEVFKAYHTLVKPMFNRISTNIHENRTLVDIKNHLLPQLISGKLRVGEVSETVEALAL